MRESQPCMWPVVSVSIPAAHSVFIAAAFDLERTVEWKTLTWKTVTMLSLQGKGELGKKLCTPTVSRGSKVFVHSIRHKTVAMPQALVEKLTWWGTKASSKQPVRNWGLWPTATRVTYRKSEHSVPIKGTCNLALKRPWAQTRKATLRFVSCRNQDNKCDGFGLLNYFTAVDHWYSARGMQARTMMDTLHLFFHGLSKGRSVIDLIKYSLCVSGRLVMPWDGDRVAGDNKNDWTIMLSLVSLQR